MPFSDAASSIRPLYSAAVGEKPPAAIEELAALLTGSGFVFFAGCAVIDSLGCEFSLAVAVSEASDVFSPLVAAPGSSGFFAAPLSTGAVL